MTQNATVNTDIVTATGTQGTTVESNSASPFSRKYCPQTAACLLSFHLNATMKSSPNYVNPWNIQCPAQEPNDISPFSTMSWSTSETENKLVCFIFHFMLWTAYCIMCILYCTICLYCSFYVVCVLPIQLLGCHSCNKRLSYNSRSPLA